jgi:hypothetical protein
MRIGILSDTHDRELAMKAAMQVLKEQQVEFYIHCGDVGSQRILDQLAGVPSAFVWGNNDWDRPDLKRYAQRLGIGCFDSLAELDLGGKKIAVIHGDDYRLKQQILQEQRHDYLLQGHTHVRNDQKVGKIRCINPGALHRAKEKTVAVLNTDLDQLEFFVVPGI